MRRAQKWRTAAGACGLLFAAGANPAKGVWNSILGGVEMKAQVIALAVAAAALVGCDNAETKLTNKLVTLCEEKLYETLLAPSGYRRVSVKEAVYIDRKFIEFSMKIYDVSFSVEEERDIEDKKRSPAIVELLITYDAPNQYGTLVRGKWECEYLTVGGGSKIENYKHFNSHRPSD